MLAWYKLGLSIWSGGVILPCVLRYVPSKFLVGHRKGPRPFFGPIRFITSTYFWWKHFLTPSHFQFPWHHSKKGHIYIQIYYSTVHNLCSWTVQVNTTYAHLSLNTCTVKQLNWTNPELSNPAVDNLNKWFTHVSNRV